MPTSCAPATRCPSGWTAARRSSRRSTIDDREGRNHLLLGSSTTLDGLQHAGGADLLLHLGADRLLVRDALSDVAPQHGAARSLADLTPQHLDSAVTLASSAAGQALSGGRRADQRGTRQGCGAAALHA
jgi:hypothetical protein